LIWLGSLARALTSRSYFAARILKEVFTSVFFCDAAASLLGEDNVTDVSSAPQRLDADDNRIKIHKPAATLLQTVKLRKSRSITGSCAFQVRFAARRRVRAFAAMDRTRVRATFELP
jgi:hypothetical protein